MPASSDPVIITASGGSYIDAASGQTRQSDTLHGFVQTTNSTQIAITPVTELISQCLSGSNSESLDTCSNAIAPTYQPLTDFPVVISTVSPTATLEQKNYTADLVAMSEYAKNLATARASGPPQGYPQVPQIPPGLPDYQLPPCAPYMNCGPTPRALSTALKSSLIEYIANNPTTASFFSTEPQQQANSSTVSHSIEFYGARWINLPLTSATITDALDACSNDRTDGLSGWVLPDSDQLLAMGLWANNTPSSQISVSTNFPQSWDKNGFYWSNVQDTSTSTGSTSVPNNYSVSLTPTPGQAQITLNNTTAAVFCINTP